MLRSFQKYVYEGEKKDGDATLQHGKGKAVYPNGDEYEGEYKEGKRDGQGTYMWIKTVRDSLLTLPGNLISVRVDLASPIFFSFGHHPVSSTMCLSQVTDEEGVTAPALDDDGKPIFQSTYTGAYVANLKDGEGVFEYPDGSKYQGNWRHDKRHGDGVY